MRRVVTRVVVCAVVGVVVNVLVAWGLALWPPKQTISLPEIAISSWPAPAPADWPLPQTQTQRVGVGWTWKMAIAQVDVTTHGIYRTDIGLPWRSFSIAFAETFESFPYSSRNYIPLDGRWEGWEVLDVPGQRRLSTSRRAVPIRPMWSGTIANSMAYGALAWLVMFAPGLIRRRVRVKGGRCVACGYDLRGVAGVCPECGAGKKGEGKAEALTADAEPSATLPGGE